MALGRLELRPAESTWSRRNFSVISALLWLPGARARVGARVKIAQIRTKLHGTHRVVMWQTRDKPNDLKAQVIESTSEEWDRSMRGARGNFSAAVQKTWERGHGSKPLVGHAARRASGTRSMVRTLPEREWRHRDWPTHLHAGEWSDSTVASLNANFCILAIFRLNDSPCKNFFSIYRSYILQLSIDIL